MTPYDRFSVMHYQFLTCGINGNYDNTGLSELDRLAVHILYPETGQVAEFVGTTVVRSTNAIALRSAWEARGANLASVAANFQWTIPGFLTRSSPEPNATLPVGTYTFEFSHSDFLGRNYSYQGTLRVLSPTIYDQQTAASIAALLPLL